MIQIPIEIGDIILTGRFRNKPVEVKEIGIDQYGHPTVNGKPILKIRIKKFMQNSISDKAKKVAKLICQTSL